LVFSAQPREALRQRERVEGAERLLAGEGLLQIRDVRRRRHEQAGIDLTPF